MLLQSLLLINEKSLHDLNKRINEGGNCKTIDRLFFRPNIIIETDNYEVLSDLGSEDDSDNDDETSIKENINKEKYVNIKENILKFHKTTETVETVETIPILQDEGKSTLPEPNKEIVKEPSLEIPSEKVLTPVVKTTPKNVSKPIQKDKDKEKDKRVIKANKKLEKKLHNSINE